MSVNLPNLKQNLYTYPGTAPSINQSHPASNKLRLALVPFGSSAINLVNGKPTTGLPANAVKRSAIGPALSLGSTSLTGTNLASITETASIGTLAVIFTFTTFPSLSRNFITVGNGNLELSTTPACLVVVQGSTVSLSPTLPTPITGHSYFWTVSFNAVAPKVTTVLTDLTTGQIYTANSGATSVFFSAPITAGTTSFTSPNQSVVPLCASSFSAVSLRPSELKQWARDPWNLWYDRSTQNVSALAAKGAGVSGITLVLASTDAHDGASFGVNVSNKLALSSTDAHDTASFTINATNKFHMSATDATDTFAGTVSVSNKLHIAATDAHDSAAFTANVSNKLHLSATDAHDTFSGVMNVSNKLHLSATDAKDTASFTVNAVSAFVTLVLSATDATDHAAFSASVSNKLHMAATDAHDTFSGVVTVSNKLHMAATDAADHAAFVVGVSNKLRLSATDAQDHGSFAMTAENRLVLAATDAKDTASFNLSVANEFTMVTTDAHDTASFEITAIAAESITVVLATNDAVDYMRIKVSTTVFNSTVLDETITVKANPVARILYWQQVEKNRKALARFR